MAITISPIRIILTSSTWIDGVRSVDFVIRLSAKLLAMLVSHNATIRSAPALISSSGVSRNPPSTIATWSESSNSSAGCNWPTTLSAAISHADIDTSLTMNSLRMTDVTRRMTSHASASLAATASR
jgi:hypothetical protein